MGKGEEKREGPFILSSFFPILRAAVPPARSSLSITVDVKRMGLRAVYYFCATKISPLMRLQDSSRMVNPKTRPSANRPKASDTSMHYSHADVDLMTPIPRHEGSKSGRIVTSTPASGSVAYPSSAAVTSARVSSVGAPVGASTDFVKPANVLPKPGLQRTALLGSAKKPGKSKGVLCLLCCVCCVCVVCVLCCGREVHRLNSNFRQHGFSKCDSGANPGYVVGMCNTTSGSLNREKSRRL